jgi:hypothetical protein
MATAKIEERIGALEREVQLLKLVIGKIGENQAPWWDPNPALTRGARFLHPVILPS